MDKGATFKALEPCALALVSGWGGADFVEFEKWLSGALRARLPDLGQFLNTRSARVANFGRGQYLLLGHTLAGRRKVGAVLGGKASAGVSVDLGHARSGFLLSGSRSDFVLNKELAVYLTAPKTPPSQFRHISSHKLSGLPVLRLFFSLISALINFHRPVNSKHASRNQDSKLLAKLANT